MKLDCFYPVLSSHIHVSQCEFPDQVLAECQRLLLWCATPDAVVRSREPEWSEVYHQEQQHEHLQQYLQQLLQQHAEQSTMAMAQVFSRPLALAVLALCRFVNNRLPLK